MMLITQQTALIKIEKRVNLRKNSYFLLLFVNINQKKAVRGHYKCQRTTQIFHS